MQPCRIVSEKWVCSCLFVLLVGDIFSGDFGGSGAPITVQQQHNSQPKGAGLVNDYISRAPSALPTWPTLCTVSGSYPEAVLTILYCCRVFNGTRAEEIISPYIGGNERKTATVHDDNVPPVFFSRASVF